jgi:uncharacterized protein YqeY
MLFQDIKKANIEALKNKETNARAIYSVLINKCMLLEINKREKGEELEDSDVVSLIQKTLKELEDEISNFEKVNNTEKVDSLKGQMEYIKKFLPAMLNESEINSIIEGLADKSIPNVMKHFKVNYAGKCDMSLVSKLAKQYQG